VTKRIADLPDRDDAPFCECAESANADFIVTLNPGDFPQKRLKAKVIAPSDPLPPRERKPRRGGDQVRAANPTMTSAPMMEMPAPTMSVAVGC
jgi:hypothetical protein